MNATAATADAKNALTVTAGRDINIQSGKDASDLTEHSKQTSKGLLSASSLETHDEVHRTDAVSSQFGGDTVTLKAGHNLTVEGSQVIADNDLTATAGKNITVTTTDEAREETHLREEKKSGLIVSIPIKSTIYFQTSPFILFKENSEHKTKNHIKRLSVMKAVVISPFRKR